MPPSDLTPRQTLVAQLVARGHTDREIAARLQISYSKAKEYVLQLRTKWKCNNRTQVAVTALRTGVAPLSDGPPPEAGTTSYTPAPDQPSRPIDGSRAGSIPRESP